MNIMFDTSLLRKDVLDSIDYISNILLEKYPGIDFTIIKKTDPNSIWFLIHDKHLFLTNEFQEFILIDLCQQYLWAKKIFNIIFVFQEHL